MIRRAWRLAFCRVVPPITWWWIMRPLDLPPLRLRVDDRALDVIAELRSYSYPIVTRSSAGIYVPTGPLS